MKYLLVSAAVVALTGCVATEPKTGGDECDFMKMLEGVSCIEPNHEEIAKHPLGSKGNPVRAAGAAGQREYLSRLICANGDPIAEFSRVGSVGMGPYGFMLDLYEVLCDTNQGVVTHSVYMDLYHAGYRETRPAHGFSDVSK